MTLSFMCEDCGSTDVQVSRRLLQIRHEAGCPVLKNAKLLWLAEQNLYEAAALDGTYGHLVADYGSAPVRHITKRN